MWPTLILLILTVVFILICAYSTQRCTAYTRDGQRCRRMARGILRRCHHHHGATIYDAIGLLALIVAAATFLTWLHNDGPHKLIAGITDSTQAQAATTTEKTITHHATVTHITDGDTITATWQGHTTTVRLLGIDAPEIAHPTHGKPHGQPCGTTATHLTSKLVKGKTVTLTRDTENTATDKYGRTLAYVTTGNTDVSAALLKHGLAEVYHAAPDIDRYHHYQHLAAKAPTPDCARHK